MTHRELLDVLDANGARCLDSREDRAAVAAAIAGLFVRWASEARLYVAAHDLALALGAELQPSALPCPDSTTAAEPRQDGPR